MRTIKFTKTQTPGLRESRYVNNSLDTLAQLSNVYDVNMVMYGNTVLYPGQLIWVQLEEMSDPQSHQGLSFALGLGGYHIVTSVSHKIDVNGGNKLVTTVDAKWCYSGSPTETFRIDSKDKDGKLIDNRKQSVKDACGALVTGAERIYGLVESGHGVDDLLIDREIAATLEEVEWVESLVYVDPSTVTDAEWVGSHHQADAEDIGLMEEPYDVDELQPMFEDLGNLSAGEEESYIDENGIEYTVSGMEGQDNFVYDSEGEIVGTIDSDGTFYEN